MKRLAIGATVLVWIASVGVTGCSSQHRAVPLSNTDTVATRLEPLLGNPALGPADARNTVVVFQDLRCGMCRHAYKTIQRPLLESEEFKRGEVRLIFAEFPLGYSGPSRRLSEALKCADEQDRYFDVLEGVMSGSLNDDDQVRDYLAERGGDGVAFSTCLNNERADASVKKDYSIGRLLGVNGTPTYFVNGERVEGALTLERLLERLARRSS